MATKVHGRNGLIYVSGTEIVYGNTWEAAVTQDSAESMVFGDSWMTRAVGGLSWNGSITALHDQDSAVLYNAATAGTTVAVLMYPSRSSLANYVSGNAIFTDFRNTGTVRDMVTKTVTLVGDGSLTKVGNF